MATNTKINAFFSYAIKRGCNTSFYMDTLGDPEAEAEFRHAMYDNVLSYGEGFVFERDNYDFDYNFDFQQELIGISKKIPTIPSDIGIPLALVQSLTERSRRGDGSVDYWWLSGALIEAHLAVVLAEILFLYSTNMTTRNMVNAMLTKANVRKPQIHELRKCTEEEAKEAQAKLDAEEKAENAPSSSTVH